jgi:hypothetical protein
MRRAIRLFQQGIGFRVSCDLFAQQRHFLAGIAAEPEIRPERQRIRIKEDPKDARGRPLKQFNARGHLRTPRPSVARFKLNVTGQLPEFQRQIISSAVDLRPQYFQIPYVFAPKPAQQFAEEYVLYEFFRGRWIPRNARYTGSALVLLSAPSPCPPNHRDGNSLALPREVQCRAKQCSNRAISYFGIIR